MLSFTATSRAPGTSACSRTPRWRHVGPQWCALRLLDAHSGPPAQYRLPRGADLVEAGTDGLRRRRLHALRIRLRLVGDREHPLHEAIERLLRLGLRGLDHQRA